MNILFLPDRQPNPYQQELADALQAHNMHVTCDSIFGFNRILGFRQDTPRPDVIHLHRTHPFVFDQNACAMLIKSFAFFLKLCLFKCTGGRIVWTAHNPVHHKEQHAGHHKRCNACLARLANAIIAHTAHARDAIQKTWKLQPNKIQIIPHGHYINIYDQNLSYEEARNNLNVRPDQTLLLYFGELKPYQGIIKLIQEFKALQRSDALLMIVGSGRDTDFLQEIVHNVEGCSQIRLMAKSVPKMEVRLYMKAADVCVFPFQPTFTSGSVALAMSFAKCIVAPDIAPIREYLGTNGAILFDTKSDTALKRALTCVLDADKNRLHEMGLKNFHQAQNYGWEKIAAMTAKVYTG